MIKLSRKAEAVWEAFNEVSERVGIFEDYGDALAAALEAAGDQLKLDHTQSSPGGMLLSCREQLLAIAAELRGTNHINQEDQ